MFIFLEGSHYPVEMPLHGRRVRVIVEEEYTFVEAIKLLASHSLKDHNVITIFTNFFTVGCRMLESREIRGLERIALGEGAIEVTSFSRKTKHIRSIHPAKWDAEMGIYGHEYALGIGAFSHKNILIVGDSPGEMNHGYNTPFVGSGCSVWFSKRLEEAEIPEDRLYWINSKNNYGVEAEQDFLDVLQPKAIFCLGNVAAKWAHNLKSEFNVVKTSHPQYWLRFQSGKKYPLIDLILKAIHS